MKLHTTRTLIRGVAARWRAQYRKPNDHQAEIQRHLDALDGETATAADVARIIGNKSWTSLHCHECGRDVDAAVEVGEPPDYESSTATICGPCLRAAVALLARDPGTSQPVAEAQTRQDRTADEASEVIVPAVVGDPRSTT